MLLQRSVLKLRGRVKCSVGSESVSLFFVLFFNTDLHINADLRLQKDF